MCSKRSKGNWFNSIVQAQHVKSCKNRILKLYIFYFSFASLTFQSTSLPNYPVYLPPYPSSPPPSLTFQSTSLPNLPFYLSPYTSSL